MNGPQGPEGLRPPDGGGGVNIPAGSPAGAAPGDASGAPHGNIQAAQPQHGGAAAAGAGAPVHQGANTSASSRSVVLTSSMSLVGDKLTLELTLDRSVDPALCAMAFGTFGRVV